MGKKPSLTLEQVVENVGKKPGTGAVLCLGQERISINREVVSVPVWEI
jgi:hypothetical protein